MTRSWVSLAAIVACSMGLGAPQVQAGVVTGLYGTGVDANNVTVADSPGIVDTHWTLVAAPGGVSPVPGPAYIVPNGAYPIPPWVANDPQGTAGGSKWISGPVSPIQDPTPNGFFDYQTTFQYSGGPTDGLAFYGQYSADDQVTILLNGTAMTTLTPDQGYGQLYNYSFAVTSLNTGANTLTLRVNNTHNVVQGVRATVNATPEPSTIVMGVGGILVLTVAARRKGAKIA